MYAPLFGSILDRPMNGPERPFVHCKLMEYDLYISQRASLLVNFAA